MNDNRNDNHIDSNKIADIAKEAVGAIKDQLTDLVSALRNVVDETEKSQQGQNARYDKQTETSHPESACTRKNEESVEEQPTENAFIDLASIIRESAKYKNHACVIIQKPDGSLSSMPYAAHENNITDTIFNAFNNGTTEEPDNEDTDEYSNERVVPDEECSCCEIGITDAFVNENDDGNVLVMKFSDGTKTIAVCDPADEFNIVAGASIALLKKFIGNQGFHNFLTEMVPTIRTVKQKSKKAKKTEAAPAETAPATKTEAKPAEKKRGRKPKAKTENTNHAAKKPTAKKTAAAKKPVSKTPKK